MDKTQAGNDVLDLREMVRQVPFLPRIKHEQHTREYLVRKHAFQATAFQRRGIFDSECNRLRAESSLNASLENSMGHIGLDTRTVATLRMVDTTKRNLILKARKEQEQAQQRLREESVMPANFNFKQRIEWLLNMAHETSMREATEAASKRRVSIGGMISSSDRGPRLSRTYHTSDLPSPRKLIANCQQGLISPAVSMLMQSNPDPSSSSIHTPRPPVSVRSDAPPPRRFT
eukprot:Sspe_Gene.58334::Locus_31986_Transcript_1_1_Confidence_1.000_Length_858::g.58334::m.58334